MLKAGIFLDVENLSRNGGWGMRYHIVSGLVTAQQAVVVRANAYMAIDRDREADDPIFRKRSEEFRNAIRRAGFHLVLKEVRRYRNDEGEIILKANADLDLAVEALLQAENLDYILLGSGDGDFLRLVRALQSRGKRVDLLSFANTSEALRQEVDYYHSGFLVPDLLPAGAIASSANNNGDEETERLRGILYAVNEEKGYGFILTRRGLAVGDVRPDIFVHIRDFVNPPDNATFANLKTREAILEFDVVSTGEGRYRATRVTEFNWQSLRGRGAPMDAPAA